MKYHITLISLFVSILACAQTAPSHTPNNLHVKVSPNKDTLWLVDDSISYFIADVWKRSPNPPHIIYVPVEQVAKMRKLHSKYKTK